MENLIVLFLVAFCCVEANNVGRASQYGRELERLRVRSGGPLEGRAWNEEGHSTMHVYNQWHSHREYDQDPDMEPEVPPAVPPVVQQPVPPSVPAIPPEVPSSEIAPEANQNQVEPPPMPAPPGITDMQLEGIMKSLGGLLIQLARESYKFKVLTERNVTIAEDRPYLSLMVHLAQVIDGIVEVLGYSLPTTIQQCLDLGSLFPPELITPSRRVALLGQIVMTLAENQNLEQLDELTHLSGMEEMAGALMRIHSAIILPHIDEPSPEEPPSDEEPSEQSPPINTAVHQLLDLDM